MLSKTKCIAILLGIVFLGSCKNDEKPKANAEKEFTYHEVIPANFPDLNIKGFTFPEDSTTINSWVHNDENESIYLHGWGIWTGLTSYTDQFIPGDSKALRVFETWMTPEEIIDNIKSGQKKYNSSKRSNRANLKRPNQFNHRSSNHNLSGQETVNDSIHESVSYSPSAAKFATDYKIFMAESLYKIANSGAAEIPFFPNDAITIKPVFKILEASTGNTMFNIASWHGTTDSLEAFPESSWESFVTVDITNKVDRKSSVYHLNDFIHYKLNEEDIHYFKKEFTENEGNPFNVQPGDIAILVAMHVGSREISNWTWQTFWWDANPDNPPLPSSKMIADSRPKELTGAARHYAMSLAYYMVDPNEPYSGSGVKGNPNYAFNPYLEAGFGPNVFNDEMSFIQSEDEMIVTYVGVRTNCMSCHRMASIDPNALLTKHVSKTPYVGNSYVSKSDSIFEGQLLLDFAWSIEGNIDTTGFGAFLKNQ